jgi:ABC-type antimicrobial peptide transport system permease subunit
MIRIIIGIIIGVALFASVSQADEQKTVTPKEFVETVVSVPGKVQTH